MKPPGALVISLDLELVWGVLDVAGKHSNYRKNVLWEHIVVRRLLDLFDEYNISATWAIVGFLFAENIEEISAFRPKVLPNYKNISLNTYGEQVGENEIVDPMHFGLSMVKAIRENTLQEIGSHSYCHYYCGDSGQNLASFREDIESAIAIARSKEIVMRSYVFPRNQVNEEYIQTLSELGLDVYRGIAKNKFEWKRKFLRSTVNRYLRFISSYAFDGRYTAYEWRDVEKSGIYNVKESMFLRSYNSMLGAFNQRRISKVINCLDYAAESGKIFHLWWHPHNFGGNIEQNMDDLRTILENFKKLSQTKNMISLNMGMVADYIENSGIEL